MRKPHTWTSSLLLDLGAQEAFVGDLVEEYASGRSRLWYWRQVLAAVWLLTVRSVGARRTRAFLSVVIGWATLLIAFAVAGDRSAEALAGWLWNWNRPTAYATGVWWPFQIVAAFVSYSGFALSAVAVVRLNRRHAASMLVAYTASVLLVLSASGVLLEILIRRSGAVPVPHPLFYAISVTLPYQWRSGLLLAPSVVLIAGLFARSHCPPSTARQDRLEVSDRPG
jgi:hypothetical protein